MTEEEWLGSTRLFDLLTPFSAERRIGRKLRLFQAACCRSIWDLIPGECLHRLVEAVEQYAEESLLSEELGAMQEESSTADALRRQAQVALPDRDGGYLLIARDRAARAAIEAANPEHLFYSSISDLARLAVAYYNLGTPSPPYTAGTRDEVKRQCDLLRDIIGNPYRPCPAIAASWLTWNDGCVPKLAQTIYDDRTFDELPILADALEDAGCAVADILTHLRSLGPHVRGCWAVDLILGKG
jgi:hypothetical protein